MKKQISSIWSIAVLILTVHAACPGGFDEDGPNACWRRDLAWLPTVDRVYSTGDLVVSPDGDDANPGTAEKPVRSLAVARDLLRKRSQDRAAKHSAGPVLVWLRGGRHLLTRTLSLGASDGGSAEAPVIYQSWPGERAEFTGAIGLPRAGFELVSKERDLRRLHPAARGRAMVTRIDDQRLVTLLQTTSAAIDINGTMGRETRFPNRGFAHLGRIADPGAVYTEGRSPGDPPRFTVDEPIGARFPIREPHDGNWQDEVAWNRNVRVTGYFLCDWLRETRRAARIDAEGVLTLDGFTRYGVKQQTPVPRRAYLTGLLCEMDAPGEWFFDRDSQRLFVMPPEVPWETVNVWAGPGFVAAKDVSHLAFVNIDITGISDPRSPAAVSIENCRGVVLAGCTILNSSRMAVAIKGGSGCGLQSCDIHDVTAHLQVEGGDTRSLTPCGHFVDNCHLTQVAAEDFYGRVAIRGVGIRFTNNLIHNFPGQPVTPAGNDQLLARNEIFNVGVEEGDGGAIYAAAQPWAGYGQIMRHNFLHHLMCVPQLHPRGGIYLDQFSGGSEIVGNVLHKAAHRAILINGGSGVLVRDNLITETPIGIYQTAGYAAQTVRDLARFEKGELKRGDVGDYVWRMEQALGSGGWNAPPWSERFPRFAAIMNQPDERRFSPIGCEITGNRFSRCGADFLWRLPGPTSGTGKPTTIDVHDLADVPDVVARGNGDVPWDAFQDPAELNFSAAAGDVNALPEIPFAEIGLYADRWRPNPPDKAAYRRAVRDFFDGIPSYDAAAKYRLEEQAAGGRRLNTGRLLHPQFSLAHPEKP